jgi:asparagine synthase (glutamine-hydrolysing)
MDLKIIITDNDLRKVTTMSHLAGVTPRYPLLDPALAEFTGTIPPDLKVRGTQLRYIFKKAMQDVLPQEIIKKTKHGFGLPYSVWLGENKPLRDFTFDVLGSEKCRGRGYFRRDLLEWLWSQYEQVHRQFYGEMLWVFLMLELWHVTQQGASVEREVPVISLTGQPN